MMVCLDLFHLFKCGLKKLCIKSYLDVYSLSKLETNSCEYGTLTSFP